MTGTLYLCATPIGNLEDITFRVLRTLKEVDLIAAEDTRNSIKLLNHFEIKTPMTSYHEFNKIDKAYQLVAKLKEGKNIALITDAGTPGISDPGEDIVPAAFQAALPALSVYPHGVSFCLPDEAYFPPRQAAVQVPSKLFPYAIFTSPLISSDNIPILAIPHST